ncbi:MAG: acyl-CoA dehydrogenase family protein [Halobacteriales archaeon]
MKFNFVESDEHKMIRETVEQIAEDYDDDYWQEVEQGMFPDNFWQDCADAGFLGTMIDEEHGGEGMGLEEFALVTEEFSANGCLGVEMLFVVNVVFGAVTLQANGSEEQKEEYIPGIVDGDLNWAMALTEPNAGHNAPEMETIAEEDDGEYVINGTKQWISGVDKADKMLLAARTTPLEESSKRTMGVTLFLVDPQDSDIERRELDVGIPTPEKQFELSIDGYVAQEDDIVGTKEMGIYHLFDTLNPERLIGNSGAIGIGRCALDRAIDYANDREVFDGPIGQYQGLQHPIADAYSELHAARELIRKACRMQDEGYDPREVAEVSNMAKLRASEAGHEACDVALQTHGGNGFSREYAVIEMWKGTRLAKTAPGSSEMMKNFIAEHTLGMPRSY